MAGESAASGLHPKTEVMVLRILSSIVLIPPLLLLLLHGSVTWFFLLLLPVGAVLLYEWHAMVGRPSWPHLAVTFAVAWLLLLNQWMGSLVPTELLILLYVMILFVSMMPHYPNESPLGQKIGYPLTGMVYCVFPLMMLLEVYRRSGGKVILFLLLVIWATDSGALIVGRWLGRRKLAVAISPGKTVAGFWGGIACGGLVAMMAASPLSLQGGWIKGGLIGVLLSVLGQLGDLAESMLKREANVKDSGRLIPGHGGLLDRLDSLLFATPALYLLLRFWDGYP